MKIPIVFISDNHIVKPTLASIASLSANTQRDVEVIYLLTSEMSNEEDACRERLIARYSNLSLSVRIVQNETIARLPKIHRRITNAALYKMFLPTILKDYDAALYVDGDILFRADIHELVRLFNSSSIIQAVWNPGYTYDNRFWNADDSYQTFNSGLMLLNLQQMRDEHSEEQLFAFIEKNEGKTSAFDQPAFNAVFYKRWESLPLSWNVQYKYFMQSHKQINVNKKTLKELQTRPKIVHFTTDSKPWSFRNMHPYRREFQRYLSIICGKRFRYVDFSARNLYLKIQEEYRLLRAPLL